MRTLQEFFLAAGISASLMAPAILRSQSVAAGPAPRVTVAYLAPSSRDKAAIQASPVLNGLGRFLTKRAARYCPPGYTVSLLFYSIDLAGDANRGAPRRDAQLWKLDLHFPGEYKFYYTVTDAAGKVVKAGREDLVSFDYRTLYLTDDTTDFTPPYFDERILDNWLSNHLSVSATSSEANQAP